MTKKGNNEMYTKEDAVNRLQSETQIPDEEIEKLFNNGFLDSEEQRYWICTVSLWEIEDWAKRWHLLPREPLPDTVVIQGSAGTTILRK